MCVCIYTHTHLMQLGTTSYPPPPHNFRWSLRGGGGGWSNKPGTQVHASIERAIEMRLVLLIFRSTLPLKLPQC